MPRICYIEKSFRGASELIVQRANQIITDYTARGFQLTLRQLYYQFVSRGWIANKQSEYKRLGCVVNDARLAGLIDWDAIEDRGRNLQTIHHWTSPADIIDSCVRSYRIDLWEGQPYRPEVWVEKDALAGVLQPTCDRLRIDLFPCRGYVSQSEMWDAGRNRLRGYVKQGQTPVILHLGDHDPSGIDMTRDISYRLKMFVGKSVEVRRLALNMDQIEEYNPPPNPAKSTDARFRGYQQLFGTESWELDALLPEVLDELITTEVDSLREDGLYAEREHQEEVQKASLSRVRDGWPSVEHFVNNRKQKKEK
jgi:hypothetical protein